MRRGAGVASVDLTSIIQRPCSRREAKIVLTPPPSLCLTAPPVGKKEEGSPFPQARGKLYGPASSTSSPTSSHLLTSFSSFTSDPLALLLGLQWFTLFSQRSRHGRVGSVVTTVVVGRGVRSGETTGGNSDHPHRRTQGEGGVAPARGSELGSGRRTSGPGGDAPRVARVGLPRLEPWTSSLGPERSQWPLPSRYPSRPLLMSTVSGTADPTLSSPGHTWPTDPSQGTRKILNTPFSFLLAGRRSTRKAREGAGGHCKSSVKGKHRKRWFWEPSGYSRFTRNPPLLFLGGLPVGPKAQTA